MAINRNKRSISLDIRSHAGRGVLERLIGASDVMLDNLRAPQREPLRLTYPHIEQINPSIVSCSVTGFGSDGPYEDRPAYDIIVEALAGVMSLTGPKEARACARASRSGTSAPGSTPRSRCSPDSNTAGAPAEASTSTSPCSTRRSRCFPTPLSTTSQAG
ncbi:MAG: CoA transferase [Candidatus Dormibacteraeota bacterium]|nr:CoA transferase [Candidatus Dormibacteraeota bacterium]